MSPVLTTKQVNNIIKNAIINNNPLSFGKMGHIEYHGLLESLNSNFNPNPTLFAHAGIYVNNLKEYKDWAISYIKSIKDLNYILSHFKHKEDLLFINKFWEGDGICYDGHFDEPYLLGEEGWHYSLKNKTVLCISPFSETIKSQVKNFNKIWPGSSIGKLITITSPYPEIQLGDYNPKPWRYKLNLMLNEIDKCEDFDFATIGCGGFSLILCQYIKNVKKKPCIHLGGTNQILYGVRSKRSDMILKNCKWYGTEHWVRPIEKEIPKNYKIIEDGCYW